VEDFEGKRGEGNAVFYKAKEDKNLRRLEGSLPLKSLTGKR